MFSCHFFQISFCSSGPNTVYLYQIKFLNVFCLDSPVPKIAANFMQSCMRKRCPVNYWGLTLHFTSFQSNILMANIACFWHYFHIIMNNGVWVVSLGTMVEIFYIHNATIILSQNLLFGIFISVSDGM